MGSFSNGFVFTIEPDFEGLADCVRDRNLRGYAHRSRDVWLLDAWEPSKRPETQHRPFTTDVVRRVPFESSTEHASPAARQFLDVLPRIKQQTFLSSPEPEHSGLKIALAISHAVEGEVYFFAADDELVDCACIASKRNLSRVRCRFDQLDVEFENGSTLITPLLFEEHPDYGQPASDIPDLTGKFAGVVIRPAREIEALELYANPAKLWPSSAGDPGETLGFGTWEPLMNLERDFQIVFQRPAL